MPKFANALNPARLGWLCTLLGAIVTGFRKVRTDRTGGVTIILALSLPAMIGFAGLGTEAAKWYLTRRTMQGAADTAAAARAGDFRARRGARQCQPHRRGLRRRARPEQRDIDDDLGKRQHAVSGLLALRQLSEFQRPQYEWRGHDPPQYRVYRGRLLRRRADDRERHLSRRRSAARPVPH